MDNGSFVCERDDLHEKGACPICEAMPKPDRTIASLMKIYQRCRERHSLPFQGGVMDQPEDLMEAFDVIDERLAVHKKRKADEAERQIEFDRMRR